MSNFLLSLVFLLLPLGLSAQLIEGDDCSNPIDLSSISSPYIGSTINAADDYSENDLSGSDLMFYYDLEPGTSICVEGTDSNFSLVLAMYVGGDCPGGTMIDYGYYFNNRMCYTNNAGSIERVWIIVDSYGGPGGEFQLNWRLDEHPAPLFDDSNIDVGDDFAILRWGSLPGVDGWQVKYGRTGFDVDTEGELVTTEDVFIDIEDLEPNTSYDLYLRTICEVGRESEWSDPITIKTHILGDYCNDAVDISTLTSPVIESTANAFANGYYNDLYGYINLNPGESIEIQIVQADSSSAFCDVYAGEDCDDGEWLGYFDYREGVPFEWKNNSEVPVKLWFVFSVGHRDGGAFEFNWTLNPCMDPAILGLDPIGGGKALLSFIENGDASLWEVAYGRKGFVPGKLWSCRF